MLVRVSGSPSTSTPPARPRLRRRPSPLSPVLLPFSFSLWLRPQAALGRLRRALQLTVGSPCVSGLQWPSNARGLHSATRPRPSPNSGEADEAEPRQELADVHGLALLAHRQAFGSRVSRSNLSIALNSVTLSVAWWQQRKRGSLTTMKLRHWRRLWSILRSAHPVEILTNRASFPLGVLSPRPRRGSAATTNCRLMTDDCRLRGSA